MNPSAIPRIAGIHFRLWPRTLRAIIVFAAALLLGVVEALPYRAMLVADEKCMSLGEIEGLIISVHALYSVFLYLYLVSDVPTGADVREFIMARIGRTRFLLAEELYLVVSALLFMLLPRLSALITISPSLILTNCWSAVGLELMNLLKAPEITPLAASLLAYAKGTLYCVVLGNVLLAGNTCFKEKYGFVASVYLHGFFWAMTLDGVWGRWALFSYSLFSLNVESGLVTLAVDLALILALFLITRFALGKRSVIGGQHD